LRRIGFHLDAQEQKVLKSHFGSSANKIDIQALCGPIDPVIVPIVAPPQPEESTHLREEFQPPTDTVNAVLQTLGRLEKTKDISFGDEFRARDAMRRGTIAASQFRSILMAYAVPVGDVETLAVHYKASSQLIHYGALLRDQSGAGVAPETPVGDPLRDEVAPLLLALCAAAETKNVSVENLFAKYDATRSGVIPNVRIKAIFDGIAFHISEEEEDLIKRAYQDRRMPEMIDYRRLCLDALQLADTAQESVAVPMPEPQGQVLDRESGLLISAIRERIQARRRKVRDAFSDAPENSAISEQKFRTAFGTFGLAFREADMQKVLKIYRVNRQKDVDWERFCRDVESTKVMPMY
jgi:Ca2+-binding EF-hand superfamily protein